MPTKLFQKGNPSRKGQKNPNAGRPKDWFKKRCDDILYDGALFNLLGKIAKGTATADGVDREGKRFKLPPDWAVRVRAIAELADRAHGKPSQHLDVTNDQALMELLSAVSLLIKQKVPHKCRSCKADLGILEILARDFEELSTRFGSQKEQTPFESKEVS